MTKRTYTDIEIQNAWQKLAKQKFSNEQIKKQDIMNALHQESHSTLVTLKKRLAGRVTVFLIGALMTTAMFFLLEPSMQYLFGVITLFQLILAVILYLNYRKMDAGLDLSSNVLKIMKNNLRLINQSINTERINNLLLFPVFALIIWVGIQIENEAILKLVQKSNIRTVSMVVIVAFPLIMLYGEFYFRLWYGTHIKKLKENINRMETLS